MVIAKAIAPSTCKYVFLILKMDVWNLMIWVFLMCCHISWGMYSFWSNSHLNASTIGTDIFHIRTISTFFHH